MKNKEKYFDEIVNAVGNNNLCNFKRTYMLKKRCTCLDCGHCNLKIKAWLEEEYVEQSVDWSKIAVDTKVLVSDDGVYWRKRHFAKFVDDNIYCFLDGRTSWTTEDMNIWDYVKLSENE